MLHLLGKRLNSIKITLYLLKNYKINKYRIIIFITVQVVLNQIYLNLKADFNNQINFYKLNRNALNRKEIALMLIDFVLIYIFFN